MQTVTENRHRYGVTQGARDLLAAAWLGEQSFAQLGLHRAVSVLDDPRQRTKVIGASWKSERPVGFPLLAGLGALSLVTLFRKGNASSCDTAASACALGAVACSIGCAVAGRAIGHADGGAAPIQTAFRPDAATGSEARRAQGALTVLAGLGMLLGAASIGLSVCDRALAD